MPTHDLTFQTGDSVPANGIYESFHSQHLLAQQVVLFKSEKFPRCSRCDFPVTFLLHHKIRALDYMNNLDVRVPLVELEPITLEDSPQSAAAQLREQP
jgi:hypothetical protein